MVHDAALRDALGVGDEQVLGHGEVEHAARVVPVLRDDGDAGARHGPGTAGGGESTTGTAGDDGATDDALPDETFIGGDTDGDAGRMFRMREMPRPDRPR